MFTESRLLHEQDAEDRKATAIGMFQAATAVAAGFGSRSAGKKAIKQFNKWLDDMG